MPYRPRFDSLEERATPANLLFFGNSYTNAGDPRTMIPSLVRDIAVAAGQTSPGLAERTPGGETLLGHAAAVTPTTIRALMPSADVVIFQGQSQETWTSYFGTGILNNLVSGAQQLGDDVRAAYPNARIVLYETWARPGPDPTPDVYPTPYASPAALQNETLAGYVTTLNALRTRFGTTSVDLAGAGEAFRNLGFASNLYVDAGGHASPRGALAAALALYGVIYDDNVSDIPAARAAALLQSRGLGAADWAQATAAADLANGQIRSAQNRKFVQQLYRDFLGREADAGGLDNFHQALTVGTLRRDQLVGILLGSDEYLTAFVDSQYRRFLGRGVDSVGLAHFLANLRAGMDFDRVRQALLASDEFYVRSGSTPAGFVRELYQLTLNRAPDTNAWDAHAAGGPAARSAVAWAFLNSTERRTAQVGTLYTSLLRRTGDVGGVNGFVALLQSGWRVQDAMVVLSASAEYLWRL